MTVCQHCGRPIRVMAFADDDYCCIDCERAADDDTDPEGEA